MKLLVNIGHPAHVHYFRNTIRELENRGHSVKITARDKDVTKQLLDAYSFEYTLTDKYHRGLVGKILGLVKNDIKLYKIAREFKPDLFVSFSTPYAAHVSRLLGKKHIVFTDTEHAKLIIWLTFPFSDVICTPQSYTGKLDRKKHLRFRGFFELAYLHPNYFKPDYSVLDELDLNKQDKFFILRFVSWKASHDIGQMGLDLKTRWRMIEELEKQGKVFITSEEPLTKEFDKYRISVSPEKIHDLLYYATMYVGEGATMASEAAVLGTPSIYINTLRLGYLIEQEDEYGLTYNFCDSRSALEKVIELLGKNNLKEEWQKKREKMLKDKIDVTEWMVNLIENFDV